MGFDADCTLCRSTSSPPFSDCRRESPCLSLLLRRFRRDDPPLGTPSSPPRNRVFLPSRLEVLQDVAEGDEALAAALFDPQSFEEAAAQAGL